MSRFGIATPGEVPTDSAAHTGKPSSESPHRRRWRLPALVAALLAALASGYGIAQLRQPAPAKTVRVLAVATNIAPGTPLHTADLTTVVLPAGQWHRRWLAARDEAAIVNATVYATQQLASGTLLTNKDITTTAPPGPGDKIVGVDLKGNEAPVGALPTGTMVTVLVVPAATQPPYASARTLTTATVWYSTSDGNGGQNIDLVVPAADATAIAGDASHDEIALVRLGH